MFLNLYYLNVILASPLTCQMLALKVGFVNDLQHENQSENLMFSYTVQCGCISKL
jgi:hypothetical protein